MPRYNVLRAEGSAGVDPMTTATCCTALWCWAILAGAILLAISRPSLNYDAAEPKSGFNIAACQAAIGGVPSNDDCAYDAYDEQRWRTYDWYVLTLPLPALIAAFGVVVLYIMWNNVRLLWWLMVIVLALSAAANVFSLVNCVIWWINCSKHAVCSTLVYDYSVMDHLGMKFNGPDVWFIIFVVALGVVTIAEGFLALSSAFMQFQSALALGLLTWNNSLRPAESSIEDGPAPEAIGETVDPAAKMATLFGPVMMDAKERYRQTLSMIQRFHPGVFANSDLAAGFTHRGHDE